MPFDSLVSSPYPELPGAIRLHVRAALAGWVPRPLAPPPRRRFLALLRAVLAGRGIV